MAVWRKISKLNSANIKLAGGHSNTYDPALHLYFKIAVDSLENVMSVIPLSPRRNFVSLMRYTLGEADYGQ